jgi:hypothetical protein
MNLFGATGQRNLLSLFVSFAILLLSAQQLRAQCATDSALIVGPADQYAFQWCNGIAPTALGLYFSSSAGEYQFRGLDGSRIIRINPSLSGYTRFGNTDVGTYGQFDRDGDLTFVGNADYLVPSNRYAFRAQAAENYGLFFNGTLFRYEFLDGSAFPVWYVDANSGDMSTSGGYQVSNTTTELPGMIRWTGADFEGYDGSQWLSLSATIVDTDDQTLSLVGTDLTISEGNTVDLSSIDTDTDDQTLSLAGTDLTISEGNTIDLSSIDTDSDDQTLSLVGSNLSIADGNTVNLGGLNTDNQTLNLTGTDLNISGGNTVDLSSIDTDTDTDDQTLSLAGSNLSIADGNTVDLSGIDTDTDDQTISLVGTTLFIADGNSTDLASINSDDQTLSLSGTDLTISGGNTIDLSSIDTDTDTDDQTLSLVGSTLSIADGNSVDLSGISGGSGLWSSSGSIVYYDNGFVGIGTDIPSEELEVLGQVRIESASSVAAGGALSLGTFLAEEIRFDENDIQSYSSGVAGGLLGINTNGGDLQIGRDLIYDGATDRLGINASDPPTAKIDVRGDNSSTDEVFFSKVRYTGTVDVRAMLSESTPAPGYGYGLDSKGAFTGVLGWGEGQDFDGGVFGLWGFTDGTDGERYGVYGSTFSTAPINYGVYSVGDLAYTGSLISVSDRKLKSDSKSLEGALDIISRLKPKTYNYRNDQFAVMNLPEGLQYGFIAQELAGVVPELVSDNVHPGSANPYDRDAEPINYRGINYIGLIPILTAGVQEMQDEVDAQEQQIEDLEILVGDLQEQIALQQEQIELLLASMQQGQSSTGSNRPALDKSAYKLYPNVPNPFERSTAIYFELPEQVNPNQTYLALYDMKGNLLKRFEIEQGGRGQWNLDMQELPASTYLYTLFVEGQAVASRELLYQP